MGPLARYVLLQLPGWVVVAALLFWLWPMTGFRPVVGGAVLALWIAKDFAIFPLLRIGYESGKTGVEQLVGLEAVVCQAIDPVGYVRVRGERWRAELAPGASPLAAPLAEGRIVEIRSAVGLTLHVAAIPT